MSYLKRTTLEDFDEAYRYGITLTQEEVGKFDKILNKLKKEHGKDSIVVQQLLEIREDYL
jgi:hypothetical protein